MENTETETEVPLIYDIIVRDLTKDETYSLLQEYTLDKTKKYIRLWKLGSMEHGIIPTQKEFEKLTNLLKDWDGKSTVDIIWADTLSLEVFEL